MPNLVGIGLSQVPTNSMLGGLAYQDPEHASIKDLDLKNLSQINSEITGTAYDIFVYDTRKDSDGGAWRKRTQHTSWYNITNYEDAWIERGSRKEFPAVAVIVADSSGVSIHDGDDPDLSLWMRFRTNGSGPIYVSPTPGALAALNGVIFVGANNGGSGSYTSELGFIHDKMRLHQDGGKNQARDTWVTGMVQKSGGSSWVSQTSPISISNDHQLIDRKTNDIAMTVLPNAPIDEVSGLPRPTIAVGTDSGVSIIKDDGTVVDLTITTGANNDGDRVDFTDDNRVVIQWGGDSAGEVTVDEIPSADTSATYPINLPGSHYNDNSPGSYSPIFLTEGPSVSNRHPTAIAQFRAVGTTAALSLFDENKTSEEDGMVAYATTSYNTGWMQGDIKGAFLSDTDTTNLSGGNKVTNGASWSGAQSSQSSTAPTGWTGGNGATWKTETGNGANGTYIRLYNENNGGDGPNSYMYQAITTVAGKKYKISVTQIHHATISVYFRVGTSANGSDLTYKSWTSSSSNTPRYNQGTFTATGTTTYISLGIISGTHNYGVGWDDVIVTEVDEDRSVNVNGLHSNGTITKSAVATGADLVSYGPFSASNYLKQPYNSDLQWDGNATWSISFWVYFTQNQAYDQLMSREQSNGSGNRWLIETGNQNVITFKSQGSSRVAVPGDSNYNTWRHICFTQEGKLYRAYKDGVEVGTYTGSDNFSNTSAELYIGRGVNGVADHSKLALVRISNSFPSLEQIKKMYEDEKVLFQENAKATLYGSSDAVTALAYDDSTNLLYAGTSSGRSEFQGLRRINNTTTAVTTAISASNGLVAEQ